MSAPSVVLGATLALGGYSFAGCSDDPADQTKIPSLASLAPREPDREPAELDDEPDLESDAARYEPLEASPGFTPDPMLLEGETSGGAVSLDAHDDRCDGFASSAPDVLVTAERPFAELSVMVSAPSDVSLMVVGPDGDARCADDVDGALPLVRGPFAAGVHRVWVGSPDEGAKVPFTLALSEFEDTQPSALLH
jgi:hypothetical protein